VLHCGRINLSQVEMAFSMDELEAAIMGQPGHEDQLQTNAWAWEVM
jgi:hypothetical protein